MTFIYYTALSYTIAAFLLSSLYLRRYKMTRPAIGVFKLVDVWVSVAIIILMHFLIVTLPLWLVVGTLGLAALVMLYNTAEPLLPSRWAAWLVALILVGVDAGALYLFGPASLAFFFANSTVHTVIIIGITNLWVQSGLKARDAVMFAGAIGAFDFIATAQTGLMRGVVNRLAGLPFEPFVGGLGFGDMLFITLFALVMLKAFGHSAGLMAIMTNLGVIVGMLVLIDVGILAPLLPMMTPLAPLMILQYLYWRQRQRVERTMWQYLSQQTKAETG
jgi:hypothetical protein